MGFPAGFDGLRSKWFFPMGFSDSLSLVEDDFFAFLNITNLSANELPRSGIVCFAGTVTRMSWFVNTNGFTGGSTNTLTVRAGGSDGLVLTIASGAGTGLFTVNGIQTFVIDDRLGVRWNSDSVGVSTIRGWGIGGFLD